MGAEIGIGALLAAAGISAFGSLAGSAISASGAQATNANAMKFNAEEAEKNRAWQQFMYDKQVSDQQRMYNLYQSPQAIAKQLSKIGVNPAGAFASGKSGFTGSMSSVPSPSGGSQASIGSLDNPAAPFGQALSNTTKDAVSVLNSLTDKRLKDAQTIKVLADAKGQEYANRIAKIQSLVAEWNIPEKARAEINQLISSAALNEARGKLSDAETSLKELMKKLTDKQISLTDEQITQLSIEVSWLDRIRRQEYQLLGEKMNTEKSLQASNYSNVRLNNALKIESGTRNAGLEFDNSIRKIDSENAAALAQSKLVSLREQYMRDAAVSAEQRVKAFAEFEKLDKLLKAYREHPNKAALDATLDNFNEHFPILGGFFKALSK